MAKAKRAGSARVQASAPKPATTPPAAAPVAAAGSALVAADRVDAGEQIPVVETKDYPDGTTATGAAPLPDHSPATDGDATAADVLVGSDQWPALIDIGGEQVPLGEIVAAAHARMGVTPGVWSHVDFAADREREIADEVQKRRAAAAEAARQAELAKPPRYADYDTLSHADRSNPDKLQGTHLRDLGHRLGLSRSEMGRMSDDKVREQLRYIAYRQYER